jgi:hypothetical protein
VIDRILLSGQYSLRIAALTIIAYCVPGTPQRKKLLAGTVFITLSLAGGGWLANRQYKKNR